MRIANAELAKILREHMERIKKSEARFENLKGKG